MFFALPVGYDRFLGGLRDPNHPTYFSKEHCKAVSRSS
jgi:hypothetical protein